MKICILIIYSHNKEYEIMKNILEDYYSNFEDFIYFYFLQCDNDIVNEIELNNNTILIKLDENNMNILNKTMKSIEFVYNKHSDFDFLIRTNISTIIDINNLKKFLKTIPNNNIYCGGNVFDLQWIDEESGINDTTFFGTFFVQGSSIIFSKDIIVSLCKNINKINNTVIDDVSFGLFIKQYHENILIETNNLKKFNAKIYDVGYELNLNNTIDVVFYRNKIYKNKSKSRIIDINNLITIKNYLIKKHNNLHKM
jgi:hypothetical protein